MINADSDIGVASGTGDNIVEQLGHIGAESHHRQADDMTRHIEPRRHRRCSYSYYAGMWSLLFWANTTMDLFWKPNRL